MIAEQKISDLSEMARLVLFCINSIINLYFGLVKKVL
jgi:hypothetical protein